MATSSRNKTTSKASTSKRGPLPKGIGYQTYNRDGSVRTSEASGTHKANVQAEIAAGYDTKRGVGGAIQRDAAAVDAKVQNAEMPTIPVPEAPVASTPGLPPAPAPTGVSTVPTPTAPVSTPGAAPTPTQNKYQQGLAAAQGGGVPAPQDAGAARSMTATYTPQQQDTTAVDQFISDDPAVNTLMAGITQLLNPAKQASTLMQDYKKLYKQSGLDEINEELIDAETVINGTTDDIRNEIQVAGGMGTESQIQVMSLARNKGLLKRYNQLVQMKTDATNQLNTLSSLNAQDKQIAQQRVDSQISTMFNMANFRQQAVNNVKEQARWMATQVGFDGIYNSYKADPRQLAMLEKTLGVAPGGLQGLATTAAADRARKIQAENMDIAAKQASINASHASTAASYANTRKTNLEIAGLNAPQDLSRAGSDIAAVSALTKDSGLGSAVGPNALARFNPLNAFTGKKANFIAGVEQLRSQLTLDSLINAKARGATFGALSDSEMKTLNASASKIGTWAVTDAKSGQITGYNTSETEFKKELDKINNFSKLDYIKKGGDPAAVGVQKLDDGSYWTQNSDLTYTKLN